MSGAPCSGAAILTVLQDYLQTLLPKLLGENGNFEVIVFGILMVLLLQYARARRLAVCRAIFPAGRARRICRIMPSRCRNAASRPPVKAC